MWLIMEKIMTTSLAISPLSREQILTHLPALADILHNCVQGGASVSFMLPFTQDQACDFWRGVADSVGRGEQLITDQPPNQPHRADVAKLLVHENARRLGAGLQLMQALEQHARSHNKSVLVLDTATGSGAETFYTRTGWQKVGEIPRYALMPGGEMTATSVFYKFL